MHPSEYLAIRAEQQAIIDRAQAVIDAARAKAEECPVPANLRPATPDDVKVGAILWGPDWTYAKWLEVHSVRDGGDFDSDGAIYDFRGKFVET